ncbi:mitochondrial ubiquitin ligase activator of nfkb 1-A-like [Mytilus californianus]|uniref:mitochondrial ubiquitin ligase activator of nfkb 1-A-like n=1 Tax=Mytilus californianus TaxID=6549 RepID=UPI0022468BE8|nr:mitochondrial ubiquitin ligase activator of nfkb 1-A-like [Mytilus californianus]
MSDSLRGFIVGLTVDAGLALIFYYFYKRSKRAANEIQKAEWYGLDKDLIKKLKELPEQTIPYGCIEGITASTRSLRSHYEDDVLGVIRNTALIEHKSKRSNGVWSDVQNVIRDVVDAVPFYLHKVKKDGTNDCRVHVTEPKSAGFLLDDLTVTYDSYKSDQSGLLQRGMDRIFGEVIKGMHEYEKMLVLGTPLLGIGQLKLENDKIIMSPPENGSRFILTTQTKEEVVKHFSSQSKIIKILLGITCVIGVGLATYILKKWYKQWQSRKQIERMAQEAQNARMAARAAANNRESSNNSDSECVICLTNPREVILLNCGHICVCIDCVQALPRPMKCPVCRQNVERFLNAYMA